MRNFPDSFCVGHFHECLLLGIPIRPGNLTVFGASPLHHLREIAKPSPPTALRASSPLIFGASPQIGVLIESVLRF